MELKTMMTYQETDIKLRKIMDAIDKSEYTKRMEQAKQEFNLARQNILECEKEAEKIVEFYQEAEKQFADSSTKLEELELIIENASEDAELTDIISETERLRQRIVDLERKLIERKQRAEKVLKDYRDAGERGKKLRDIHNSFKEKLESLRKENEPAITALKTQLFQLEQVIDGELLEKYKSIVGEGKFPALVEAYEDGSNTSCRGCGLSLSQKTKSELIDKGVCRCETCRRILYRKQ